MKEREKQQKNTRTYKGNPKSKSPLAPTILVSIFGYERVLFIITTKKGEHKKKRIRRKTVMGVKEKICKSDENKF